jgi:hypothetical protein
LIIVSAQRSGPAVPGLASRVASAIAGGWDL